MFTGIVEEIGEVTKVAAKDDFATIWVKGEQVAKDAELGCSIAVSGVCLTVTSLEDDVFSADLVTETLNRTTLGQLKPGQQVNLEPALRANDRLGGHMVSGHVEAVGALAERVAGDNCLVLTIACPSDFTRYLVPKGSITIDGVSLTVTEVEPTTFAVSLIPTTITQTTLGALEVGDSVNLEADLIGKYLVAYLDRLNMKEF